MNRPLLHFGYRIKPYKEEKSIPLPLNEKKPPLGRFFLIYGGGNILCGE